MTDDHSIELDINDFGKRMGSVANSFETTRGNLNDEREREGVK